MEVDPTADILRSIIQTGSLDYKYVTDRLVTSSKSSQGYFFEVTDTSDLKCKYSTNSVEFTIGVDYDPDDIPDDPVPWYVFEKSVAIAVIYLDKDFIEGLDKETKQRAHDSICIGAVINRIRSSNYQYSESVCVKLLKLLQGIYQEIRNNKDTTLKESINKLLSESVSVITDLRKYSTIITNITLLQKETVNMQTFVGNIVDIINDQLVTGNCTFTLETSVADSLVFDKRLVMDILLTSLIKLIGKDVHLDLRVSSKPSYKEVETVFLEFLILTSEKDKISQIFKKKGISVDSVGLYIITKLIALLNGDIQLVNDQLRIRIEVDRVNTILSFLQGKRVLLSVKRPIWSGIYNMLIENHVSVSISNSLDQLVLYKQNQDNFDAIILDQEEYLDYFSGSSYKVLLLSDTKSTLHTVSLSAGNQVILETLKRIFDPETERNSRHYTVLCISKTRVFLGNLTIFMSSLDVDIQFSNAPVLGAQDNFDVVFIDCNTVSTFKQYGKLVVLVNSLTRPKETGQLTNYMTIKDLHNGNLHDILNRIT